MSLVDVKEVTEQDPSSRQEGEAGKVLRLPAHGPLLFCTDLHGNLRDFNRMRELFLIERKLHGRASLLFCGDLVHGPCFRRRDWPDYLGTFYEDQSGDLIEGFMALASAYPGDVHCLLGNHEHSHIGGPHTPKFWEDETAYFEGIVGPERTRRYRSLFRSFPLVAVSRCGLTFTHAAPNVEIESLSALEQLQYGGHQQLNLASVYAMPPLGRLLWARRCPTAVAARFLATVSSGGELQRVVVFGHDIAPEGYERFDAHQLMLSTSFGLLDEHKTYLRVDLEKRYGSAHDLRQGHELLPLY
jgi:hypothetical protein